MISVIITSYREATPSDGRSMHFWRNFPPTRRYWSSAPIQTAAVVDEYSREHLVVRHVADPGQGKPMALNCGLAAARGEIVVLSDGDVVVGEDALRLLLAPFADAAVDAAAVGATTGHPLSASPRDTMLGYWSHLLTDSLHRMRLARDQAGQFLLCSGYLFAFRRALIGEIPIDALAEDAVISHEIAQAGYRIRYAPEAQVYVRYPTTYRDWLRQKVRSAGGYAQDYIRKSPFSMRSRGGKSWMVRGWRWPIHAICASWFGRCCFSRRGCISGCWCSGMCACGGVR